MTHTHQRIVLASRPQGGAVSPDNFRLERVPVPSVGPGQVLVRNHVLSLDPYMRGRMSEAKSYAAPQPLGEVMLGGTAGEVIASRSARWQVGDTVVGMGGWQTHQHLREDDRTLRKVDTSRVPLSAYLGVLGMPGVTAWYGLRRILEAKPGQTIVVSAASGAVGSVVGQLAKLSGCRVVGFAGGAAKCAHVEGELGFDACIDYKAHAEPAALGAALRAACPDGVDRCFENVGGAILDATMLQMNAHGRIALCGMIAGYDGAPIPMRFPQLLLVSRLRVEGFIISEHLDVWPEALTELGTLMATKKLRYRESIAQGLDAAPEAFLGLLSGKNLGKQLVDLR
jgi:NADPH-dependent curcumin reductase